ncbi:hypothetical protein P7K49_034118 [Saguinus oedipus]|uniref:Uncharacterized protein n=1 Tax=Saguinus oedipus TaxID=9490 RepID=A0ABQ9TTU0_SAGOE|nr:hypothetical protein P7K49_034118 [Saguinus oedipus]
MRDWSEEGGGELGRLRQAGGSEAERPTATQERRQRDVGVDRGGESRKGPDPCPPEPAPGQRGGGPRRRAKGTYVGAGGPEPAASWGEGRGGGCCVQAEGVARGARAGGDPDGLSHFLSGFLTSEPGWEQEGETLRATGARGEGFAVGEGGDGDGAGRSEGVGASERAVGERGGVYSGVAGGRERTNPEVLRKKGLEGATRGTGRGEGGGHARESYPTFRSAPLPPPCPTDENTQTEQGKKPNAHLLSSRHGHRGARRTDLRGGDQEVQGGRTRGCWVRWGGADSRIPGAGGLRPRVWGADGLFGGSSLPRPGEGQRGAAAPALGWVGRLIPGSAPGARLGPHRLHPVLRLPHSGRVGSGGSSGRCYTPPPPGARERGALHEPPETGNCLPPHSSLVLRSPAPRKPDPQGLSPLS